MMSHLSALLDIAAPDPMPSLAEFIGVVLVGLQPVRDAALPLASMSQLLHFFRLHDEAHRGRGAGIDDDDPPVADEAVERVAERDRVALRQRLDLNAFVDVGAVVIGEQVDASRVPSRSASRCR